jgi:hypothetical protein
MLLVTTACVSIPDSSPVSQHGDVNVNDQPPPLSNDVPGPQAGAEPAQIVEGFFGAMLAYPQNSAVAREFLTPGAAVSWDPRVSTVVYTGLGTLNESGNVVSVPVEQLGRMDGRGSWSTAPAVEKTQILSFRLQQVKGEWRISNPEPGSYIRSNYFERNYFPYSLYFVDPTQQWLTPDPVHLIGGDTTATALVSDLLLGPSPALAGVATSGAPAGTQLDTAVTISPTGVATVPLTPEFLRLSEEDRRLFASQLSWTLGQLPGVRSIAITVDGAPVPVAGVDQEFGVNAFPDRDPRGVAGDRRLYALARTGLVQVDTTDTSAVPGPISQVRDARSVAVNPSGQLGAVVSADGTSVVVGGMTTGSEQAAEPWVNDATSLLRPSWDQHGVLWLIDRTGRDGGARLLTATARNKVRVVDLPAELKGQDIRSFAVSTDGVRAAAILMDGDLPRLVVSVIDRSADDVAAVSLRAPRTVRPAEVTLSSMSSLSWVSPTAVAVLGDYGGQDTSPYVIAIDGSAIDPAGGTMPAGPTSLAASGSSEESPIVIGDADGRLYGQTPDLSWELLGGAHRLRAPVYPG